MRALNALNLAIRFFVVELGGLAAAAYWGWEATPGPGRWYLAVAAPVAFVVSEGSFWIATVPGLRLRNLQSTPWASVVVMDGVADEGEEGAPHRALTAEAPVAFIAVWGLFIAPKARFQISKPAALAIELVLLGLVAVGLAVTGLRWLGIAYGTVALLSGLVNYAFKP